MWLEAPPYRHLEQQKQTLVRVVTKRLQQLDKNVQLV